MWNKNIPSLNPYFVIVDISLFHVFLCSRRLHALSVSFFECSPCLMGWIAASGGAAVAAFAVHSFWSRNGSRETLTPPIDSKSYTDIKNSDYIESTAQEPPTSPPATLDVSPPSIEIDEHNEQEEQEELHLQRTESSPSLRPAQLMPPPPIPRARSSSPPRLKPPTFSNMTMQVPGPPSFRGGFAQPPPSAASSLRVPQTKVLSNTSMAPSLGVPRKRGSRQVILGPGYSPLDWAALTSIPNHNLRGKDAPEDLIKVTPSMLKQQNGRKGRDIWTSFQGKVYNVTPYMPFHPGGKGEMMRGAGKDCTKLFMETHPWVNMDMLRECLVGIMVSEDEAVNMANNSGGLDDMD